MSLLSIHNVNKTPLKQLVDELRTTIRENGVEFVSQTHTQQIVSLESLNSTELESLNMSAQSVGETLRTIFDSMADFNNGLGFESLTPVQLEAGVIAAMAAGDPVGYATAALTKKAQSSEGIPVIEAQISGPAGQLDFRDDFALEAFDESVLSDMIPYSIAFNVQASRQDEFSEAFFPTTVVSPDNGGIDIGVDRITVMNAVKHRISGKTTDFDQRNLNEAVADATILADESTALIPYFTESGENEDKFVDPALVTPYFRNVAGVDIRTGPLKVGESIDLLGISQHPQLMGVGVMDNTDAIGARIVLNNLYLQHQPTGTVIRFNVSRIPRNTFLKSIEGQGREMSLNFRNTALRLTPDTTAVDGTLPAFLDPLRTLNWNLRISVNVTGNAHVEYGTVQVFAAPVIIDEITDDNSVQISTTSGTGKDLADMIKEFTVIGYELNAVRTNSNRRTQGLLINNIHEKERFALSLSAPISALSPTGSSRDAKDLDSLITAARIRNSNNAITTLLNYIDTLRAFVQNRRLGQGHPAIEGVGRFLIVPYFEEIDLDLPAVMNNLTSSNRADDVAAVFVNTIREVVYRMYRDSAYQAALNASNTGSKKPKLLVGTDLIIPRYLIVPGDNRTFGIAFEDAEIVSSFDARMDSKIILAFTRDSNSGTPDPLAFGCHAWMPELASTIPAINRNGATFTEVQVQTRNRHINNLPIMAVINVIGLKEVLTEKSSIDVNQVGD